MNTEQPTGIVLVSGGMDSLVAAAIAQTKHQHLAMLHVNYQQRTQVKELECFHKIADYYQVPEQLRLVVDISFLQKIGGSSLTDPKMPVTTYQGHGAAIPTSYVPFRNTHIIAIAVSWAEVLGATRIYIGAVEEDSSGYPDCRQSYYQAMNALIKEGTKKGDIVVKTPLIRMQKKEIIQKALELRAPLEFSWSCYQESQLACGVCDSCALRLRAFQQLGLLDPLPYREIPHYLA